MAAARRPAGQWPSRVGPRANGRYGSVALRRCAPAGEPKGIRDAAEPVAAPDPAASIVSRCVPGVRVAGCRFGRAGELHRSARQAHVRAEQMRWRVSLRPGRRMRGPHSPGGVAHAPRMCDGGEVAGFPAAPTSGAGAALTHGCCSRSADKPRPAGQGGCVSVSGPRAAAQWPAGRRSGRVGPRATGRDVPVSGFAARARAGRWRSADAPRSANRRRSATLPNPALHLTRPRR